MSTETHEMTKEAAVKFMNELATYFDRQPTKGEDSAHWSKTYNALNCRKIAELLQA